jgi:hypothetical protein
MGAIVIIAAFLFVVLLVMVFAGGPAKAHREWRKASQELGLRLDEKTLHLTGELSGVEVEAQAVTGPDPYTELKVHCDGECTKKFVFGQEEQVWTAQLVDTPSYQSGDPWFDDQVSAHGDPCHLAAVLDSPTRRGLAHVLTEMDGMVNVGVLRARRAGVIREAAQLAAALQSVVRLANAIAIVEHEIPARLSTIVRKDPIAAVRGQCIGHLAARYPQSRHTKQALKFGRRDRDSRVRLWAGRCSGNAGIRTIQLLVGDDEVRLELRTEGLDYLVTQLAIDHAGPLLSGLVGSALSIQAIAHLGRLRYRPAMEVLLKRISSAEHDELIAMVSAFGHMGGKRAEAALVYLMKHPKEEIIIAAINALTVAAGPGGLDKLRRWSARKDTPPALKAVAQTAVVSIEERLHAQAQALAIVPAEEEA